MGKSQRVDVRILEGANYRYVPDGGGDEVEALAGATLSVPPGEASYLVRIGFAEYVDGRSVVEREGFRRHPLIERAAILPADLV